MNVTPAAAETHTGTRAAPRGRSEMGKDQFLQLLVAQLRNQDPLNPTDPREFGSQLAQFSSLEQMVNIGAQLEQMNRSDSAFIELVNANSALGLLGKNVLASTDEVAIPESGATQLTVDVGSNGASATLRLLDEQGNVVETRALGALNAGRQVIEIEDARPGRYRCELEIRDVDGKEVPSLTYVTARVSGIEYTSEGPVLICGELSLPLSSVIKVDNP